MLNHNYFLCTNILNFTMVLNKVDKMKIGFDAKRAIANKTGLGNYSRFVINNLAHYYPENSYFLFSEKPKSINSELSNDKSIFYVIKERFAFLWRIFGVKKEISENQIDIYHGLSNELPYNLNKSKVKSVLTMHDVIFRVYPKFYPLIDRMIYNIKARYSCKQADYIVAVSECTKKDVMKYYHVPSDKISVVYQGCNNLFYHTYLEEEKKAIQQNYGLPSTFLLSVGTIEERKNILQIVKALKTLPEDIHFVAIGKGKGYAKKVQEYIDANGLTDRVHFLTGVPLVDLPLIYQLAKIFVYTSLYEGFGIPIVEAQACGLPVIAATGSCLEEAGGEHSIYVNPHSAEELASAIQMLLSNPQLCDEMITKGKEYIKRFSDEVCTRSLMKVYSSLL